MLARALARSFNAFSVTSDLKTDQADESAPRSERRQLTARPAGVTIGPAAQV